MNLAQIITDYCAEEGISYQEFSDRLGFAKSSRQVYQYLYGKKPSEPTARRLAELLDISFPELCYHFKIIPKEIRENLLADKSMFMRVWRDEA